MEKAPSEFRWNENQEGYEGVSIQQGRLLWFSHRENELSPSVAASFQEFADFLENGPRVSDVPGRILELLKARLQ